MLIHEKKNTAEKQTVILIIVQDHSERLETMAQGKHTTQWAHSENRQNHCGSNQQRRVGSTSAP